MNRREQRVPLLGRWRVPLHWPSLRGRARSDAGLLVITAVLLALAAAAAVVVPRQLADDADLTVRAALSADAARAAVQVQVQLGAAAGERGVSAVNLSAAAQAQAAAVGAAVPGLVGPPVAVLTVPRLVTVLARGEQGLTSLRVVHAWREGETGVRWLAGGPAGPPTDGAVLTGGAAPPPLQVGLAEPVAAALGVGVGDAVPAASGNGSGVDVALVVSGVFAAEDPSDPVWAVVPGLLGPAVSGSGPTAATDLAAVVDDAQVPVLVALPAALPVLTTSMPVRPEAVAAAGAGRTAQRLAALEAAPATQLPGVGGAGARLRTGADDVLREASARVDHLRAQASVLLGALGATTAALLVVAAGLLAQRRAAGLAVVRTRGAPLASTAAEAALESAAVAALAVLVGAAAGAAVLRALGLGPGSELGESGPSSPDGSASSALALAGLLAVLAVAAPAAAAVVAARDGGPRPARRTGRGPRAPGDRALGSRAVAAESAVVLLAALALVSLVRAAPGAPAGPLVAGVVPLSALAVALVARRAVLPLLRPLRRATSARTTAAPLLAVSRLEAAARRTPALVAVALACAGAAASVVVLVCLVGPGGAGSGSAVGPAVGADPRTAPAVQGLVHLAAASAGGLSLLAALAVVLDAAASAPARRTAAVASAVLGLPPGARRAAALGELLPSALAPAVLGCATGALLGLVLRGPLGLPALAGSSAGALCLVAAPAVLVGLASVVAALSERPAGRSVP